MPPTLVTLKFENTSVTQVPLRPRRPPQCVLRSHGWGLQKEGNLLPGKTAPSPMQISLGHFGHGVGLLGSDYREVKGQLRRSICAVAITSVNN